MPVVERPAFAASFPSTVSPGPTTMNTKSSSTSSSCNSPESPDAVSALLRMQHQQPQSGKPPISPPSIVPRMSPTNNQLPTLTRLPSLTSRTTHHQQQHFVASHRPSVVPTPQVQTRLTPAVPLPPSPQGNEPPSPRELAARLALLLHARECCTPFDMERVCGVRNCRVARGVLDHCQECFLPEGQCHRSCSEAKQLLRHFRICRAQQFQRSCAICDTLRGEFAWAMQHARSLTPLFVPRSQDDQDVAYQQEILTQQRRHSSYQPEQVYDGLPAMRRSVSEGPHVIMSAGGHHKRTAAPQPVYPQPKVPQPTAKRVRIVTPTEEAAARGKASE